MTTLCAILIIDPQKGACMSHHVGSREAVAAVARAMKKDRPTLSVQVRELGAADLLTGPVEQ